MKWEGKKKLKNYFLRAQRRFDGDFISRESPHHGHMIFYDRWKEIKFRHFRISTKRQLNCYSKVENAAFLCKHRRSFARKRQRRWRVAHIFFFHLLARLNLDHIAGQLTFFLGYNDLTRLKICLNSARWMMQREKKRGKVDRSRWLLMMIPMWSSSFYVK